jgi:hypothetical protein
LSLCAKSATLKRALCRNWAISWLSSSSIASPRFF